MPPPLWQLGKGTLCGKAIIGSVKQSLDLTVLGQRGRSTTDNLSQV